MTKIDLTWNWVVVDDHSTDDTFDVLNEIASTDPSIQVYRFSRNFGSHAAITCGLTKATGDAAIVMAADLQDPPESIPQLVEEWRSGGNVVWAARRRRLGESKRRQMSARLYYWIMRNFAGFKTMRADGADFFLLDRLVIDALNDIDDKNVDVMVLISWLGFDQRTIVYDKQPRLHGETGWTFSKNLKLTVDSIAGFSYFPIRLISVIGLVVAFLGFIAAIFVTYNALTGTLITGYASIMICLLVLNGLQMVMLGVLGKYIWRGLDEKRGRPSYIVQKSINASNADP